MNDHISAWEELGRELIFEKYGRGVEKVDFKLPSGVVSDYYVHCGADVAATLALTPRRQVILCKQFRPGPKEVLLEMPGGFIDAGEDPAAAGERELREETGYGGDFQLITIRPTEAYSARRRAVCVATNCRKIAEPQREADEFIEVVLLSLQQFRAFIRQGRVTDLDVAYLGLDYLGLL